MSLFDDAPPPPRTRPVRPVRRPEPEPAARAALPAAPVPLERLAREPEPPPGEPAVVGVSALTEVLTRRLRELGRVAVEGEVTRLSKAGSGHVYFTLKEGGAVLDCKIWRSAASRALRAPLPEGARVVCHGTLDVYAPRGTYSLIVDRVERRGIGELLAQLEELKADLRARGWFERARPLPALPRRIGIVTSRDADALADILRTRSMRWPLFPVRLCHTRVQGAGAAREIAAAIARLDASGVDVIVVARGGGSLEDLWCFNELVVAEAIRAASVPVVTGVGHQTDVTLADLVADHRAHTPTDAAQTVIPDRAQLLLRLERAAGYLGEALERALDDRARRIERVAERRTLRSAAWIFDERAAAVARLARALARAARRRAELAAATVDRSAARLARHGPSAQVERTRARLEALAARLFAAPREPVARRAERVAVLGRSLEAVSPYAVLQRGYSITRKPGGGPAVRSSADVAPGERVETWLADGRIVSEVLEAPAPPGDGA